MGPPSPPQNGPEASIGAECQSKVLLRENFKLEALKYVDMNPLSSLVAR